MAYYSTTRAYRIFHESYGLNKDFPIFNFLIEKGLVYKAGGKYHLTEKGSQYGRMHYAENGSWVEWDDNFFQKALKVAKRDIIINHSNQFRLFHMTHIDNLQSILLHGLLCHNDMSHYIDISNRDVNNRRNAPEPFYNRSIHDYVLLYFNPRNAMLYSVQRRFGKKVVILNISRKACLSRYTLFTNGNAATNGTSFYNEIKEFLDECDFNLVNSRVWFDDPAAKTAMMSECLIYKEIPPDYIGDIYCADDDVSVIVQDIVSEAIQVASHEVILCPDKFFNF